MYATTKPLLRSSISRHSASVRSVLIAALLAGCGYPEYRYLDEPVVPGLDSGDVDTSVPGTDGEVPGCARPNGCGGCDDQGNKGGRCDPCGQWTCGADNKVVCVAASPVPGGTCGTCGTSKLECTAIGTTACTLEDDRLVYDDANFKTRDDKLFTVDRTSEIALVFRSVRSIAYFDASAVIKKIPYVCGAIDALPHPDTACSDCKPAAAGGFDCTVPSPAAGLLTYTLYVGAPPSLVPLATASVPAGMVSDAKIEWVTAAFSTVVSARPPGTLLTIGISTESTANAFEVHGGGPGSFPKADTGTTWWTRRNKPPGSWNEQPSSDLAHVLRGKACAP